MEMDNDIEPMEVDLPGSDEDPMEVDQPLEDDLMEVDLPPLEQTEDHRHSQANYEEIAPQRSSQGCWNPYAFLQTATLMLVLNNSSHRFIINQESPNFGPFCGLTWSLHFLVILLTAKAVTSPSFLSSSLIPHQGKEWVRKERSICSCGEAGRKKC